jgi:hypothetical protein
MRYGQSDVIIEALTADDLADATVTAKLQAFLDHTGPDGEPASLRLVVEPDDLARARDLLSDLDPHQSRTEAQAIGL